MIVYEYTSTSIHNFIKWLISLSTCICSPACVGIRLNNKFKVYIILMNTYEVSGLYRNILHPLRHYKVFPVLSISVYIISDFQLGRWCMHRMECVYILRNLAVYTDSWCHCQSPHIKQRGCTHCSWQGWSVSSPPTITDNYLYPSTSAQCSWQGQSGKPSLKL